MATSETTSGPPMVSDLKTLNKGYHLDFSPSGAFLGLTPWEIQRWPGGTPPEKVYPQNHTLSGTEIAKNTPYLSYHMHTPTNGSAPKGKGGLGIHTQISYTLPQKKHNFLEVASVFQIKPVLPSETDKKACGPAKLKWPWVMVSDPWTPGKMDRLKLRFFWRRV